MVLGDIAVLTCVENILTAGEEGESSFAAGKVVASNIFVRHGGGAGGCGCTTARRCCRVTTKRKRNPREREQRAGRRGGRPIQDSMQHLSCRALQGPGTTRTCWRPSVRLGQELVVDATLFLDTAPAAASGRPHQDGPLWRARPGAGRGRGRRAGRADRDARAASRRRMPGRRPGGVGRGECAQARGTDPAAVRRRGRHHPTESRMTVVIEGSSR